MSFLVRLQNIPLNHTTPFEVEYTTLEKAVHESFITWRTQVISIISSSTGDVHYGAIDKKTGALHTRYVTDYDKEDSVYRLHQSKAFLEAKNNPPKATLAE